MKVQLVGLLLLGVSGVFGQFNDLKKVNDFDLFGPVERCEIQTAYGTEVLVFNRDGSLQQFTTSYNESDKERITLTYQDQMLSEKLVEVFRNNRLERDLSFYHRFSKSDKALEEVVVTLNGDLVGRNVMYVDSLGVVERIVTETPSQRSTQRFHRILSPALDSILTYADGQLITIEVSRKNKTTQQLIQRLTVAYTDTIITRKNYEFYERGSRLIRTIDSLFDPQTSLLFSVKDFRYSYTDKLLTAATEQEANQSVKRRYIYQLDQANPPNWVKRIEQPSNDYITRRIIYYKANDSISK